MKKAVLSISLQLILLFVSSYSFSQLLGGRENSESAPKIAEPSTLSGGIFNGDVNNMTGAYQASIPLGSVSTPGGLSFSLSMSHSSSFSFSTNQPSSIGGQYGDGWSLDLPTISVDSDVFHRFGNGAECQDNGGGPSNTNDESSNYPKLWEGDLFWFSPNINIPGVGGGRAVFKYVDVQDNHCAVFVLNTFETPMEIRFYGNSWRVILADGTTYMFEEGLTQYRAPSNKRLIEYEHNSTDLTDESVDIMSSGEYDGQAISLQNVIEPKKEYATWYCSRIYNRNIPLQNIIFTYEKYGAFNFFQEFQQESYEYVHKEIFQDRTLAYLPDYTVYRDIILKSVTSSVVDGPLDILELEYDKLDAAYAGLSPLLDPDASGVTQVDDLYCSEVILDYGEDATSFSGWYRYPHVNKAGGNEANISGTNPYLNSSTNSYTRQSAGGSSTEVAFDHSFLESPRINPYLYGNDYSGDLFEIRTKITGFNASNLKMRNGTVDIALVTGTESNPYGSDLGTGSISAYEYNAGRGEQVFSTFNMALKWQMSPNTDGGLVTSNFFMMPNIPEDLGGFNIQIGPGNSDIVYNHTQFIHERYSSLYTGPNTPTEVYPNQIPNALAAYPQLKATGIKSAARIGHNFGTGHPWGMMVPIYAHMATYDPLQGGYNHENLFINSWFKHAGNTNDEVIHRPTKFDDTVKLTQVQLIRYSKIAYMLQGVKQYKINGEYGGNYGEIEGGKKLVAQKKLDYDVERSYVQLKNLDYQNGNALVYDTNRVRQFILLSAVTEVPIEGNLYATNYGLSDPTVVLKTKLEYENILPTTSLGNFSESAPYKGIRHYALTQFTDNLGGVTVVEYYPIDHANTRLITNANFNWNCGTMPHQAFGTNKSYTMHLAVKYIIKGTENYDLQTSSFIADEKKWEYQYGGKIGRKRQLALPGIHFRGQYLQGSDIAFGSTTIFEPALPDGTKNKTVYEYYGTPVGSTTTTESYLYYGKPKSIKKYNYANELEETVDINYGYTKAFENGYRRPNFNRVGISYYDHLVFRDYEYEDYYKQQYLTVDNEDEQWDAYYGTDLPDLIRGPYGSSHGYITREINLPHTLGEGTQDKEQPKFMEYYFFDLLQTETTITDVDGNETTEVLNPDYFLNSYFVKKTSEIKRTYEDGLATAGGTPSEPTFPSADPVPANPLGVNFVNPVGYDNMKDPILINKIQTDINNAVPDLIGASPLSDTVIMELVNSAINTDSVTKVLLLQAGLSNQVWELLIPKYTRYTPVMLHQLVSNQPYFSDTTQKYMIQRASNFRMDDKFYKALLSRNPQLSDDVKQYLCNIPSVSTSNFEAILAAQDYQFTQEVLSAIIASTHFNDRNCVQILKNQQFTTAEYAAIYNKGITDDDMATLIEATRIVPSDSLLSVFADDSMPYQYMQRILDVMDREPNSILITQLLDLYIGEEVKLPSDINPLTAFCSGEVNTDRTYIETKTEYEYYEANYKGVAQGKAYEVLLGKISSADEPSFYPHTYPEGQLWALDDDLTVSHLQLKHEPSWQVFAVKQSSPHLPQAGSREEYFYYYDLQNRYDRIWYNFNLEDNQNIDIAPYEPDPLDSWSEQFVDTFVINYDHPYWNDDYIEYQPVLPEFDGMTGARTAGLRTIAFQKTAFTKNTRDEEAVRTSEYYHYDKRWRFDDLTLLADQDSLFDGPPCPEPVIEDMGCEVCIYEKFPTQDRIDQYIAEGYRAWKGTSTALTYYMFCPCDFDFLECTPNPSMFVVPPPCGEDYGIPDSVNGVAPFGSLLSKTLQLRSVTIQVDTIPASNSEFTHKLDLENEYIAEFAMDGILDMDDDGFRGGNYRMVLPFESLTVRTIDERNRHFQPKEEHNQVNLITKYEYTQAVRKRYVNDNCFMDQYQTVTNYNIGLPTQITVGSGAAALVTSYEYTDAGMVSKVTEPSGLYTEYAFDGFHRLLSVEQNDARLLSQNAYHLWNQNTALTFAQRTEQNYVDSKTYNSAESGDFSRTRAYMDPTGRNQSTVTSYINGSGVVNIHSGSVVYDNWDRAVRAYKPFVSNSSIPMNPETIAPPLESNMADPLYAFSETVFENTPKSRALKASNYGVDIDDPQNHVVRSSYYITNNIYTSCELGLNASELALIMGNGSTSDFRFFRSVVLDQDGKQTIEYTNAMGQKVANLKYASANDKIVTLFVYDSYGNLTKVINPKKQQNEYLYNMLGQVYQETSVDAGTKKYMYNKQGLVSVVLDEQGWNHTNELDEAEPFYRTFQYDTYGRLLTVNRTPGITSYVDYAQYGPLHYQTQFVGEWDDDEKIEHCFEPEPNEWACEFFDYVFTHGSTQDWLNKFDALQFNDPNYNIISVSGSSLFSNPNAKLEKFFVYGTNSTPLAHGKIKETQSYDNDGVLIQQVNYVYDGYGNVASQTTEFVPDNTTSVITYPAYNYRGALLEEKVDVDNDTQVDIHYFYEYDRLNRLTGVYAAGASVSTKDDATLITSYAYDDANGLLLQKTHHVDHTGDNTPVIETGYGYDMRDRLSAIAAFDHYNKNEANESTLLMAYGLVYDAQVPFYNFGQSEPLVYQQNWNGNINGTFTTYDFSFATQLPDDFDEPLLYGYSYDKLNRLTRADAMVGDYIANASPEDLNEAYRVGDVDVTYDKIGNITTLIRRLKSTETGEMMEPQQYTYGYQMGTNRLLNAYGAGGTLTRTYTYDENGNVLTDNIREISATQYGRAAYAYHISQSEAEIDYLYSIDDQRIAKTVESTTEIKSDYYLTDATGHVVALRTSVTPTGLGTTTNWEYYVYGAEREARLVKLDGDPKFDDAEVSFYLTDHLGNTRISYTPVFTDVAEATTNVFNSDFTLGTEGWVGGGTTTANAVGGNLIVTNHTNNPSCYKSFSVVAGNVYDFEFNVTPVTSSTLAVLINGSYLGSFSSADEVQYTANATGTIQVTFVSAVLGEFTVKEAVMEETVPAHTTVSYTINYAADYFPYGKVLREYVAGDKERYLTTQHERDAETGLDYRGARYYDQETGRFLSLDPMQVERLELNPYNYVSGNPIMRIDPNGMLDTKFVDDEGNTIVETDDGSKEVFVIEKKYEDNFVVELNKNVYFGKDSKSKENTALGEKYGYNIKNMEEEVFGPNTSFEYAVGYSCGYSGNLVNCVTTDLSIEKDGAYMQAGKSKGASDKKAGKMNALDPKPKNNKAEYSIVKTYYENPVPDINGNKNKIYTGRMLKKNK